MNRLIRLLYSNKFVAWAILLFQLFVLASGYFWLKDYSVLFFGTSSGLSAVLLICEINRHESPEFKMTWMMLIAIIPIFGALLYVYLRLGFISKGISTLHVEVRKEIEPYIKYDDEVKCDIDKKHPHISGLSYYLKHNASAPTYRNATAKYYALGEDMYAAIKKELEGAKKFIFMEFFIINSESSMWRELFDILSRKVREGVEVRLLYDGMGCLTTLPKNFSAMLDNAGIKHEVFAPVQPLLSTYQNNRDHRKIIVIDGRSAYTGGINIADEYINRIDRFGHWKDNGIRITGGAVMKFAALFLEMWNTVCDKRDTEYEKYINMDKNTDEEGGGYVIPYGDCPLDEDKVGKRVYIDIINTAKEYVSIMTPYLVIDNEMLEALRFAVDRGVRVRIIIPHHPDKAYAYWLAHTYFPELIKAGVEMYEYTPGFIHAKTVISDGYKAVIGTINFDYRSFYLHYECAACIIDAPVISDIEDDFEKTLNACQRITMEEYNRFNPITKLFGGVIKILAPLL